MIRKLGVRERLRRRFHFTKGRRVADGCHARFRAANARGRRLDGCGGGLWGRVGLEDADGREIDREIDSHELWTGEGQMTTSRAQFSVRAKKSMQ